MARDYRRIQILRFWNCTERKVFGPIHASKIESEFRRWRTLTYIYVNIASERKTLSWRMWAVLVSIANMMKSLKRLKSRFIGFFGARVEKKESKWMSVRTFCSNSVTFYRLIMKSPLTFSPYEYIWGKKSELVDDCGVCGLFYFISQLKLSLEQFMSDF